MGDTIIGQNDGGKLNAVFLKDVGDYDAKQDHSDDSGTDITGAFGNMYTREIESFSDSVLNGKPLEVPASDAVRIMQVIKAAYRSSDEGLIFRL